MARTVILATLLVVAGVATPAGAAAAPGSAGDGPRAAAAGSASPTAGLPADATGASNHSLPDPETDRLGWEDGTWYNESIDVNQSDGVSRAELRRVLSRTMARVEQVRRLEFERRPDVTFTTEAEYKQLIRAFLNESLDASTPQRLHQNTKFEALFFVPEGTDYFATQRANSVTNVPLAFTITSNGSVVRERGFERGDVAIVRDGGDIPRIEETTLAHELVHVLQVQHFNTTVPGSRNTEDAVLAYNGVVEGDATYLGSLYGDRCGAEWNCLTAPQGPPPNVENIALVLYRQSNYAEGPGLFKNVRESRGWDAVDGIYANPPRTTEQLIHPEKYPDETGADLSIENASRDGWRPLDVEGPTDHATFGEAGLFMMLYFPSYASRSEVVIPYDHPFQNTGPGFYNFEHPASAGWNGDRLLPYVNGTSAATNETGYVWKIAWDTEADAREFTRAYRDLLEYQDARPVSNAEDAYVVPEGSPVGGGFADAFAVRRTGTTTLIVNAPSVSALNDVRAGTVPAAARAPSPTPTSTPFEFDDTPTPTPTSTPTPAPTAATTAPAGTSPPTGSTDTPAARTVAAPGFGLAAALLALAALLAVLARRRD